MTTKPSKRPGRPAKPDSERTANFSVRMPQQLRERLEATAAAEGRSVNAEIVYRLTNSAASSEPDDAKRAVVVEALMEAVGEVCNWAEHLDVTPNDEDVQRWLKEALDDLAMWHGRLQRLDSSK
ncbi:hypothetical protein A7D35_20420 [Xanthomonas arboricola]|uniref:Arc family DNA-binding protein n=1 Tax=Xanthomonas arboricola TaxID=56448 RepID=UPI0007ED4C59|nr:Arc family DNA-binding protein [Xanthomonas arboricola]OBR70629.1 hypothetical protein A7D35_20420 [Xanthomonas arboricola]